MQNLRRNLRLWCGAIGLTLAAALALAGPPAVQPAATTDPVDPKGQVDLIISRYSLPDPRDQARSAAYLEGSLASMLPYIREKMADPAMKPDIRAKLQVQVDRMQTRADKAARVHANELVYEAYLVKAFEESARAESADDRWNADVDKANELIALNDKKAATIESAYRLLTKAMDAGCESPTVMMLRGKTLVLLGKDQPASDDLLARADKSPLRGKMNATSAAHLDFMLLAMWGGGRGGGLTPKHIDVVLDAFDDVKKQAATIAGDKAIPDIFKSEIFMRTVLDAIKLKLPVKQTVDELYPQFVAAMPNSADIHYMRGAEYVEFAWDARGDGTAGTVSAQGWQDFTDCLKIASEELNKAYELSPDDERAPSSMLKVELGQSNGRDEMEMWFDRAMKPNPDNYQACLQKMLWLEPKWSGSIDEMMKFGHECVDQGNWTGGMPMMLVEAHVRAAEYAPDPAQYFAQPEVWKEIYQVLADFRVRYPDNPEYSSLILKYACKCGRWKEADTGFKKTPAAMIQPQWFGGPGALQALRKEAAEKAANAPADPT